MALIENFSILLTNNSFSQTVLLFPCSALKKMKAQKCSVNTRCSFQKGSRVVIWAFLLFFSLGSPGRSHLLLCPATSYHWWEVWCVIAVFPCVVGLVSSEALLPFNTTAAFLNQNTVISDFRLNFARLSLWVYCFFCGWEKNTLFSWNFFMWKTI